MDGDNTQGMGLAELAALTQALAQRGVTIDDIDLDFDELRDPALLRAMLERMDMDKRCPLYWH